jgi:transcription termination/antitermination factor NusG
MADDKTLGIDEEAVDVTEEAVEAAETSAEKEAVEATETEAEVTAEEPKRPVSSNVKQNGDNEPHWYVVHTYSGYENKVKADIEKTIENRRLEDQMFEVMVPLQDVLETKKDGTKKVVSKKIFPGYVLVHMIKNDVTWYVVRNTRGVTGFVGPGSEPVPLTSEEMRKLGVRVDDYVIDVEEGDTIKVIRGAWEGTIASIKTINRAKETATIEIDIFGRSTDVEIGLGDIQKLD